MSQIEKDIALKLQEITDPKRNKRFPIMMGKVVTGSVNTEHMLCSVVLCVNDIDIPTEEVMLNAVSMNVNGMLLIPADGSDVWVGELDGPGKWGILKCSNLAQCQVTIGSNKLVMNADGVTVDANVITMKAPEIKIGGGDAFAAHMTQYEGALSVVNWLAARVTTIEQRWNQFKLLYAPGSGGSPAAIPAITIPRGPSFDVMKVEKVKTD